MIELDIYIDLDGVISDFNAHILTCLGKSISDFDPKGKLWSSMDYYNKTVAPFFRTMPKMSDADELVIYIAGSYKSVKFLTASGFTPRDVKEQKIAWCAEHYPDIECIVVTKSPEKAQYAHPHAILIDDRNKSIGPWVAAGGIGILHTDAKSTIEKLERYKDIEYSMDKISDAIYSR